MNKRVQYYTKLFPKTEERDYLEPKTQNITYTKTFPKLYVRNEQLKEDGSIFSWNINSESFA